MITTLFFLIILTTIGVVVPVYAEWDYVWYGYPETGYYKAPIIYEIEVCNHRGANGCIIGEVGSHTMVIVADFYNPYGCTMRAHEWFHLMGYKEPEIPRCEWTGIPRMDWLR